LRRRDRREDIFSFAVVSKAKENHSAFTAAKKIYICATEAVREELSMTADGLA
jgi:hypothetical protein